jgi:hypothetical protein
MTDPPYEQPAVEERMGERRTSTGLHLSVPNAARPGRRRRAVVRRAARLRLREPELGQVRVRISLQTGACFFADVVNHEAFTTEKSVQLQAGNEWLQYSIASKWIGADEDATFA